MPSWLVPLAENVTNEIKQSVNTVKEWLDPLPKQKAKEWLSPLQPDFVPPAESEAEETARYGEKVKFFPSQRYIDKNLAPETTLRDRDIEYLAKAKKEAVEKGILDPEFAEYMLPMAMREGRSNNYGIRADMGLYPHKKTLDRFKKMGLDVHMNVDGNEVTGDVAPFLGIVHDTKKKDKYIRITNPHNAKEGEYAKLMAVFMAERADLVKDGSIEGKIKKYNGRGKAMEEVGIGVYHPADTEVYLKHVLEAKRMLGHESNKPLVDAFKKYGE